MRLLFYCLFYHILIYPTACYHPRRHPQLVAKRWGLFRGRRRDENAPRVTDIFRLLIATVYNEARTINVQLRFEPYFLPLDLYVFLVLLYISQAVVSKT